MKIAIFSGHCWAQKRQAGFHHLTHALMHQGHEILFYSAPVSTLMHLKSLKSGQKDQRLQAFEQTPPNTLHQQSPRFCTLIHYTLLQSYKCFSPVEQLLDYYYLNVNLHEASIPFLKNADMAIFESCTAIYFYRQLSQLNPKCRLVYRVSDDIAFLRASKKFLSIEQEFAEKACHISVPATYTYEKFKAFQQASLCLHGIDKTRFDAPSDNPYTSTKNATIVGVSHLDENFLTIASRIRPDINFHIIGPFSPNIKMSNVHYYGEKPFEQTIPFVQHADIGLQSRTYDTGAESLKDSLKVLQYTYCGLPIICPDFLKTSRVNSFYYASNNEKSIGEALEQALKFDKKAHYDALKASIKSWDEVAHDIINHTFVP